LNTRDGTGLRPSSQVTLRSCVIPDIGFGAAGPQASFVGEEGGHPSSATDATPMRKRRLCGIAHITTSCGPVVAGLRKPAHCESLALLADRFGEELFEPCPKIGDGGRGNDRDLVAARLAQRAQDGPEHDAWIIRGRHAGGTGAHHQLRCAERLSISRPMTAAGTRPKSDSTEYRPPMLGQPNAIFRKRWRLGDRFQRRAGIGDSDEARASLIGGNGPFYRFVVQFNARSAQLASAGRAAAPDRRRRSGCAP
jgi:hypothetical protein